MREKLGRVIVKYIQLFFVVVLMNINDIESVLLKITNVLYPLELT